MSARRLLSAQLSKICISFSTVKVFCLLVDFCLRSYQKSVYHFQQLKFFVCSSTSVCAVVKKSVYHFQQLKFFCLLVDFCLRSYQKICKSFLIIKVSFAYFSFQRKVWSKKNRQVILSGEEQPACFFNRIKRSG